MASLIQRNNTYYLQWYEGTKRRRQSLRTESLQIAKEKKRQFESAQFAGHGCALPTRTPVGEVVAAYIENMKVRRHKRSWSKDLAYLRAAFGECCEALSVPQGRARKCQELRDRRKRLHPIGARYFEDITAAMISDMIAQHVRVKGISATTANRYREVVAKVINWAIRQERVKMPGDANPAARVERYRHRASEIRYLTMAQIDEQLQSLSGMPQLQTMIAMLVYAGLRREELLWLQVQDIDRTAEPNGLIRIWAKTAGGALAAQDEQEPGGADQFKLGGVPRLVRGAGLRSRLVLSEPARYAMGYQQLLGAVAGREPSVGASVGMPGLPAHIREPARAERGESVSDIDFDGELTGDLSAALCGVGAGGDGGGGGVLVAQSRTRICE